MSSRDPWRRAPTSELGDQVLPRWFVLLAVFAVVAAIAVLVAAFVVSGPEEVPPAARRPPPAGGYTHAVGDLRVGELEPAPLEPVPCPALEGVLTAGSDADREVLAEGLAGLCELDDQRVEAFAADGGTVRFAQFAETGLDSTARLDAPLILLNIRSAITDPGWIAPLVVHDLAVLEGEPGSAETALAARQAEAAACEDLLPEDRRSRACADAAAILALDDPLNALREAGYR